MDRARGGPVKTLLAVGAVAVIATFIVDASFEWSHERIAVNQRARLAARLNSVLEPSLRGHDLLTTRISATDEALLGSDSPVDVFVVMENGEPVATVFASIAHGYNAAIGLLIGISPQGTITGVRTVSHRETPGLGDAIDAAKSDWISQFTGTNLATPTLELWAVDQDDGEFDSITGATVTSRAVVAAVKNTLLYFGQHRDELYRAAAATIPDATAE
jgi:Na+-translocating ferredoxin:NAD+ oxidoreductase subunit G